MYHFRLHHDALIQNGAQGQMSHVRCGKGLATERREILRLASIGEKGISTILPTPRAQGVAPRGLLSKAQEPVHHTLPGNRKIAGESERVGVPKHRISSPRIVLPGDRRVKMHELAEGLLTRARTSAGRTPMSYDIHYHPQLFHNASSRNDPPRLFSRHSR